MAGLPMCSANERAGWQQRAGESGRVRGNLKIFWRLMIRPLARERVRTALTILAVALGVAVVLAMDLAGEAATGSFHSSLETLAGEQNFEITATGGVPEEIAGKLATLPYDWQVTPRMEDYAVLASQKKTLPLLGLDLIGGRSLLPAGSEGLRQQP